VTDLNGLLSWSETYIKDCTNPVAYFYNSFAKVLRYNSFLLRGRVFERYINKKEVQLKLPKFFRQSQTATSK
jgi:hypothetical protein